MTDTVRALAAEHPALLTVECEVCRPATTGRYGFLFESQVPMMCPACNGTARRPLSLDELLEAVKQRTEPRRTVTEAERDQAPIYRYIDFGWRWDGVVECELEAGGAHPKGGALCRTVEGATEWEAAARLLIELEASR